MKSMILPINGYAFVMIVKKWGLKFQEWFWKVQNTMWQQILNHQRYGLSSSVIVYIVDSRISLYDAPVWANVYILFLQISRLEVELPQRYKQYATESSISYPPRIHLTISAVKECPTEHLICPFTVTVCLVIFLWLPCFASLCYHLSQGYNIRSSCTSISLKCIIFICRELLNLVYSTWSFQAYCFLLQHLPQQRVLQSTIMPLITVHYLVRSSLNISVIPVFWYS